MRGTSYLCRGSTGRARTDVVPAIGLQKRESAGKPLGERTIVPLVTGWFATREISLGTHLIAEPFHVNSYLVEGTGSRVHLDTGLGVADIREAGDALSGLPPFVANTHYHFDHIGGNGRFDSIA